MQITIGSAVTLHFSLSLADGMPVESSFDDEPISFVVGDGTLDKGLELALIGLRPGARQSLTLMPGQAFGVRDPAAIQTIPVGNFPGELQPQVGQIIGFTDTEGTEMPGAILSVEGENAQVDFNHPLAGREIRFEVEILSVENPPAD